MSQDELKYWVGVAGFAGMGIKRFTLLKKYFGSVEAIWQASTGKLISLGIKPEMAKSWQVWREGRDLDREIERLGKELIKVITIEDSRYPKLLKEIDLPPFILFVKGQVNVLNRRLLAVVGTRKVSSYGRRVTDGLVGGLVKEKLVVVSGLARGVDSLAHRATLAARGVTVAVLGHGLDRVYPPENRPLAEEIVRSGGVVMSEYPLGYGIEKGNFPARNRIVAGLSLGVLVVEGGHRSGTKITAGFAAEYGREVFAVPGPVGSPTSVGPADLIKQGAKLVTGVEDVLEELPRG